MSILLLCMNEELSVTVIDRQLDQTITHGGHSFQQRAPSASHEVFYDWVFDADDKVVAFEVHLDPADSVFDAKIPLRSLQYVQCDPYPRIWLSDSRVGTPAGLESWGGLAIYADELANLMIAVDTQEDLSAEQLLRISGVALLKTSSGRSVP